MNIHAYYSRPDVQKELLRIANGREVQAWFGEIRGKRPEVINYTGDLKDLIKQGMTSFHVSEERWRDPLLLKPGMAKRELDQLRVGWDILIDVDGKEFEYSRIATKLIIDILKLYDVENYTVKFSGNKGFHIGIPFESFPQEVNGIKIKDHFPDGIRKIASFVKNEIKDLLAEKLAQLVGKDVKNPSEYVDIDSVLISSRHLFRAPYSINEKSGLVSVIVTDIDKFRREDAKPENVIVDSSFLKIENIVPNSSQRLLVEAFDFGAKVSPIMAEEIHERKTRSFEIPKTKVEDKFFPPCMKLLLKGLAEDGRKRGVFIAINFLRQAGWTFDEIQNCLLEWNKTNYEPLREGYIQSQISWAKRQQSIPLPPNCDNQMYYKTMGICKADGMCKMVKNPVNYMTRKIFLESSGKRRK